MNTTELYISIRSEIITNHVLMHWFSLIVALAVLAGIKQIEKNKTILSVFLPLLSIAWSAAMVRFDFFIHRQSAYLRLLESRMAQDGVTTPLWETWRTSLTSTRVIVPIADTILVTVIVIPTIYILFTYTQQYFADSGWKGGRIYAICLTVVMICSLLSLAFIPKIASWGRSLCKAIVRRVVILPAH